MVGPSCNATWTRIRKIDSKGCVSPIYQGMKADAHYEGFDMVRKTAFFCLQFPSHNDLTRQNQDRILKPERKRRGGWLSFHLYYPL